MKAAKCFTIDIRLIQILRQLKRRNGIVASQLVSEIIDSYLKKNHREVYYEFIKE